MTLAAHGPTLRPCRQHGNHACASVLPLLLLQLLLLQTLLLMMSLALNEAAIAALSGVLRPYRQQQQQQQHSFQASASVAASVALVAEEGTAAVAVTLQGCICS